MPGRPHRINGCYSTRKRPIPPARLVKISRRNVIESRCSTLIWAVFTVCTTTPTTSPIPSPPHPPPPPAFRDLRKRLLLRMEDVVGQTVGFARRGREPDPQNALPVRVAAPSAVGPAGACENPA